MKKEKIIIEGNVPGYLSKFKERYEAEYAPQFIENSEKLTSMKFKIFCHHPDGYDIEARPYIEKGENKIL